MSNYSSNQRQLPLRQDPPASLPLPRSTLQKRTHCTLQLQSGTDVVRAKSSPYVRAPFWVPYWVGLVDRTSETDRTAGGPFTGRRPSTPESSNLRLFGSTLRFFAKQDPFFLIASNLGPATSIVKVGGVILPRDLAYKLLHVYDCLHQTRPSTHILDVPRNAPTGVFELCLSLLAKYYATSDPRLRPEQAKNIIMATRDIGQHLLALDQDADEAIFKHIALAATQFDEFRQLVVFYARSASANPPTMARTIRARNITVASTTFDRFKEKLAPDVRRFLLQGAQLMPALSHTIIARINHFYRIPFTASQLAPLLQREGVVDAVPAGTDYVVSAGVYRCTVEYGRGFLQRGYEARIRSYPRPSATPPFLDGLYQDLRARTGVAPLGEEVFVAILKEEGILTPSETLGKFDCLSDI